ncbi:exported hypothetical protein [Bradyrhizobium sp. ORS 375]|uniref:hypothetical protein n=1 Tax=Bradyrhizobium sp. (strain ORS 375) TaxID=566679 RepID=UPI00024085E2|nr:hypothetical protein [Bradyrhizobium sp. ORS 375]CCD93822.1 exported hypothetical protein [Bradyrhizobium sp. ORS 375]
MKPLFIVTILILSLLGRSANAVPAGTLLISAKGACSRFSVSDKNYTCDKLLYAELPNGRFGYTFVVPGGVMTLFGGRTSQPAPERYTLIIDKIVTTFDQSGKTADLPATGTCVLYLSGDGKIFHELHCDVKGEVDRIVIDFKSDGKPVSADRF